MLLRRVERRATLLRREERRMLRLREERLLVVRDALRAILYLFVRF